MSTDAIYLHEATLAAGLGFVLTVNGVLLVGPATDPAALCLAQGIPPDTDQAGAALLTEPDVVRKILACRGLPVPRSATLRFSAGADELAEAGKEVGFPLVLRPVWPVRRPHAPAITFPVAAPDDLAEAVGELERSMGVRETPTARRTRRFVVEQRITGTELHALVLDGEILSGMLGATTLAVDTIHPDIRDMILRAVRAIDGLALATALIAVDDPTRSADGQPHAVLHLDAHPNLATHERPAELARAILRHAAQQAGLTMTTPQGVVTVELRLDGTVMGPVTASPPALAAIADAIVNGRFAGLRPHYLEGIPA